MTKIAIIYYSTYGHIAKLAESVKAGVEKAGATATIYQFQETLPEEVLTKMYAAPKKDYPIATPETLKEADGILFGIPTRFGSAPAQVRALFDATGGLWGAGALVGKPGHAGRRPGDHGFHHHHVPDAPRPDVRAAWLPLAAAVQHGGDPRRLSVGCGHPRRW
jgi:multimeric flavodoxin WrbA